MAKQDERTGKNGRFVREDSTFRNWITVDGKAGPTGKGGFEAEPDRYHLYVSYACPWAHRTLIMRALKRIKDLVPVSVVNWHMGPEGWSFAPGPGVIPDPVMGASHLSDLYKADTPGFSGRPTTPTLWDRRQGCIVNNESADILRMFGRAFDKVGAAEGDYYPKALRPEIDAVSARIYDSLNNGVYRAGFATSQEAYDEAAAAVFETLDELEDRLSRRRYLCGDVLTEADIRLFVTLIRFDHAYHGHFKCNRRRLVDYEALHAYTREIFQIPEVRDTVRFDHIKHHYYESHPKVNPTGIVPIGPEVNFDAPHERDALG
jgi:putative glutathione S-transferase